MISASAIAKSLSPQLAVPITVARIDFVNHVARPLKVQLRYQDNGCLTIEVDELLAKNGGLIIGTQ